MAEVIAESGKGTALKRIGLQDFSKGYGSYSKIKDMNGIGVERIFKEAEELAIRN